MMDVDLRALLLWLGDAFLIIVIVAICCFGRQRWDQEDDDNDDRRQESSSAAAAPHAQPAAGAVQMATMALALLFQVTYPRQKDGDGSASVGDDHPSSSSSSAAAAEECAICLGQFEDGDWCSVMPVCCHEFHRSCVAKWLTACNNTCPLCRAQLQWDVVVGLGMV